MRIEPLGQIDHAPASTPSVPEAAHQVAALNYAAVLEPLAAAGATPRSWP